MKGWVPMWIWYGGVWAADERIGKRFLFPGIGYGGSCFPKDVQALVKSAQEVDYDFQILNAVMKVNENQKTTPYSENTANISIIT